MRQIKKVDSRTKIGKHRCRKSLHLFPYIQDIALSIAGGLCKWTHTVSWNHNAADHVNYRAMRDIVPYSLQHTLLTQ